jgi:beta-lactamase regulating signal transducer with metallopeptidase domain
MLAGARRYLPAIVLVWMAGVALLATRLIVSWVRVQRMARHRANIAAAKWGASMSRLARALGLRRAVHLLESAAVDVPTVIGWLRPVILLPASTLAGLAPEQVEMLLAHELAHIRRHDFFINLLQAFVETLMFYHPAVWWISERVRVERENCCDDLAVAVCGNPVQYARALTRLEELRAGIRYAAVAANGGSLMMRIRRLIASPREVTAGTPRWAAGAAVLSVLIALIALPSLPLFADREQKKDAPAQEQPSKPSSVEVDVHAAETDTEADSVEADEPDAEQPDSEADLESSMNSDDSGDEARPAPLPPVVSVHPIVAVAPLAAAVAEGVAEAMQGIDDGPNVDTENFGASGRLTVDELISLRSNGVTPEYIQQMRSASLGNLTLGQILEMRVQGVSPSYIRDLRAAGIDVRNAREVIAMRIQGVSVEYVQQMAAAGYRNLSVRDLISLRVQGVTPSFIKALAEAGYTNLSVTDIVRLAVSGVNAEFIREMSQYREKK